jgi:acylphosphatase
MDVRGFRIRGRVQGVVFRVWTRDAATEMGFRGTVRNLPDGSVETWVEGSSGVLEAFEARLWVGPPASKVEAVERASNGGSLPEDGFRILY